MYHYAGNNPIRYVDPDGEQSVEGSCALAEDFSLIEATTTEVATTSSIKIISKLGIVGIILAFCFCLQGDSITPKEALPANYEYTEYGIKAPNGVMIGTEAQAVKHAQGDSDWNKVDDNSEKVSYNGKTSSVYRGGKDFTVKTNEVKIDKVTGNVKTSHGVSVNVNSNAVSKFGGAYRIDSLPKGLKIIQRGNNIEHFEIVPSGISIA